MKTSAASRKNWVLAESSIPTTQIQVITAIQITPTTVTAATESAADCQPTRRNV